MKISAALAAGTVLAVSLSNIAAESTGAIELNSLNADQSANLLRNWEVKTLAAACGGVGGCTGEHLLELADTLRSGEVRDFSNRVLASVSALDLMTFGRQVEDALVAGGVSEAFVSNPRRQLAAQSSSGINIRRNDSSVTLGVAADVSLARTGYKELTIGNSAIIEDDLAVGGDTAVSGAFTVASTSEFSGDVTINGHLEVDQTISTGYGRITRDFHQFYTTTSGAYYYDIKTSIKVKGAVMYRLEILGYAYGAASNIDSVTTGYTYSGWDCVSNEDNTDFGYGEIGVYCSSDGYVVLEYYCPSTYFLGLTVSGWFLNPTGYAHDIEVLDTSFSTSSGVFAARRQLEDGDVEDEDREHYDEDHDAAADDDANQTPSLAAKEDAGEEQTGTKPEPAVEHPHAEPVLPVAGKSKRTSFPALVKEVESLREQVSVVDSLKEELSKLQARVAQLEAERTA